MAPNYEMVRTFKEVKQTAVNNKTIHFTSGVRGIKRDVNFAVANLCQLQMCQKFLISSNIEHIDSSQCLHFDNV